VGFAFAKSLSRVKVWVKEVTLAKERADEDLGQGKRREGIFTHGRRPPPGWGFNTVFNTGLERQTNPTRGGKIEDIKRKLFMKTKNPGGTATEMKPSHEPRAKTGQIPLKHRGKNQKRHAGSRESSKKTKGAQWPWLEKGIKRKAGERKIISPCTELIKFPLPAFCRSCIV